MHEGEEDWRDVDRYFIDHLVDEDEAVAQARLSSSRTVLPEADVAEPGRIPVSKKTPDISMPPSSSASRAR